MSLLLDALRKSEKRRQADAPPLSLPSGPGPYPSGPRRRGTWILIGLVVLAVVVAGAAWIYFGPFASDTGTRVEVSDANEQQLVVPEYAAPQPNRPIVQRAPDRPIPDENGRPARQPLERAQVRPEPEPPTLQDPEPVPEADARVRAETANEGEPEAQAEVGAETETETRTEAAAEQARERPESPLPSEPAGSELSTDDPVPARPAQQAAGRNSILPWELPTAARADFPDLELTLHFYASEPSNRFVLIGGERFVEGDRVADGVVLAEITREGVVVDFRNYRVRLR